MYTHTHTLVLHFPTEHIHECLYSNVSFVYAPRAVVIVVGSPLGMQWQLYKPVNIITLPIERTRSGV